MKISIDIDNALRVRGVDGKAYLDLFLVDDDDAADRGPLVDTIAITDDLRRSFSLAVEGSIECTSAVAGFNICGLDQF